MDVGMHFPRKGYGRIYVEKESDIQKVKAVIKELDEFEYDYLPGDLVAVFEGSVHPVYTHKFCDLDLAAFMGTCWQKGIKVFCVFGSEYTP